MKRNAARALKERRLYGCNILSKDADLEIPFCIYKPKSDFHGIGFVSYSQLSATNDQNTSTPIAAVLSGGKKLKISGEAFGYGALDEEDDDAVVYDKEDFSKYDFAIGSSDPTRKHNKSSGETHDSLSLGNFVRSSSSSTSKSFLKQKYRLPSIPHRWKPKTSLSTSRKKQSRWDETKEKSSEKVESTEKIAKPPASSMNANVRALLLGDEVIHMSGVKKSSSKPPEVNKDSNSEIQKNKTKEEDSGITAELIAKKPLTGFFGNKFVRSSEIVEHNKMSAGLHKYVAPLKKEIETETEQEIHTNLPFERTTYQWHPSNLLCKRFNVPNPYPQYPDVIGVVSVGSDVRNRTAIVEDMKNANILDFFKHQPFMKPSSSQSSESNQIAKNKDVKSIPIETFSDDEEEEENRPPMDLFKAIFASDEENEEADEDSEESEEVPQAKPEAVLQPSKNLSNDKQESDDDFYGPALP